MRPARLLLPMLVLAACSPSTEHAPPTQDASPSAGAHTAQAPNTTAPQPVVAAPTTPPSDASVDADPTARTGVARMDGYGGLRLGMTAAQAQAAWSDDLRGGTPAADNCVYLMPAWAEGKGNFGFMFESGRFVRYDVAMPQETAPGGGRVGMTRAQVEALYPGRVKVQLHDYVPGGSYLRIADAADPARAILFETSADGVVERWRVGLAPQVDYTEGCS